MQEVKLVSDRTYRKGFNQCPAKDCRSHDISAKQVDISGRFAYQEVSCDACGATWTDWYKLQGFDQFERA